MRSEQAWLPYADRMPDRPGSSDDDQYRWLYGTSRPGGEDADPDATRAMPPPSDGEQGPDPDATQAMPADPPPADPPPADPPPADPPPARPPSASPPPAPRDPPPRQSQQPQPPQEALAPPNLPPPGTPVRRDGPTPPPPGKPGKPGNRGRTIRRVLLALFLVWILFLIAVPIWAWTQIGKVDAEPDGDRPGDQPGATYLVVGSDSREGLTEEERQDLSTGNAEGDRTDTIMLLHTGDGPTTLVSLPRDSPVDIPGEGTNKINAAYSFGGPELLVETVEQNTGIRVDGYVEIGLGGFVNIVDALGGVEICPEDAIEDKKAGLNIESGCQEADGPTALGYARTRKFAIADLQRVQNQREVVSSIADEAASPWTLLNPWRYFSLANSGSDSLRIGEDVGPIDLARFAWAMGEVSGGGKTCTVPLAAGDATWDEERSDQLFELIIEDRTDDISDDLCRPSGLSG